ncbi:MAG: hypothetical protein IJ532_05555 [Alphaproteobacteria bacterium]|nr:hypothetical protein [Alphaproteobacteria bacterium]
MKLYHYLIKAVQEYVEDSCPEKMSDAELFETLLYVKSLCCCLTNNFDLHVADYLLSKVKTEGEKRGGLVFFDVTSAGQAEFKTKEMKKFFRQLSINERRKAITEALNAAEKRGIKFEKGARGRVRRFLLC